MKKIVLNGCYGGFSLSKEAYEYMGLEWDGYGFKFEGDRENPKLIDCVEKLGERANGRCANLFIDEYDDENFDCWIDEYDGVESLMLEPVVSEKRLAECKSATDIIAYLKSLNIKVKTA